ncbi:hypothetical protein T07_14515 [Trichinella nelsoni]|uniref:Uncharacterized protein n=1 Tax=Trichinella nelsoni TaxID=6336 RepID=A0A0V0SIX2_9BILA|nr:hypothetical protein T07_14515 [Trichinella nelsoni]
MAQMDSTMEQLPSFHFPKAIKSVKRKENACACNGGDGEYSQTCDSRKTLRTNPLETKMIFHIII